MRLSAPKPVASRQAPRGCQGNSGTALRILERHRLVAAGLAVCALLVPLAAQAQAASPTAPPAPPPPVATAAPSAERVGVPRVRVAVPFLDMRSGPGRGYPVFHVAERNEWVVIELRHTDWFKVRTARGQVGWVSRAQMAGTVTEDGVPFELADPTLQDYLNRTFEFGGGYGASKTTAITRLWAGWRFSDTLSLDVGIADVQAKTSTTGIWNAGLLAEPWSNQRLSPFMGIGVGRFHYKPNDSLVNAEKIDGNLGVFTVGARYHLASRVALRVEYIRYAVFVDETESRNYQAGTIGLSIHF